MNFRINSEIIIISLIVSTQLNGSQTDYWGILTLLSCGYYSPAKQAKSDGTSPNPEGPSKLHQQLYRAFQKPYQEGNFYAIIDFAALKSDKKKQKLLDLKYHGQKSLRECADSWGFAPHIPHPHIYDKWEARLSCQLNRTIIEFSKNKTRVPQKQQKDHLETIYLLFPQKTP